MVSKKTPALFAVSLIIFWGFLIPSTHAQQSDSNNDQIPSDLSLDLDFAQKDPAPAQKQIVQSQVSQAQTVTDKGEQAVVVVKDEVPQEVKTESTKDTVNPEQTTSEQVVNKNVEETANPSETPSSDQNQSVPTSNNPASSPTDNMIPGTNIVEPDDNTVPQVPATSPSPTDQNQNNPTVTPIESNGNSTGNSTQSTPEPNTPVSTNAPDGEQSNPIPPENAPSSNTPDTAPPASNGSPSDNSSDNSSNQPSSSDNNSGSENSGGDNSAVQGVSITWWQLFLNKILKR